MIELRTLGRVDLRQQDGREIDALLVQRKRFALLVYLLLEARGGYSRRNTLLGLFWPELDEAHARNALRQALAFLRRCLGSEVVARRGEEEVGIAQTVVRCDAVEFRSACAAGRLEDALELYQGEFLNGFLLTDAAPEFQNWLDNTRTQLRDEAVVASLTLAHRYEARGDLIKAVDRTRRALELDPSHEPTLRTLMTLLNKIGDAPGAIHAFEEFARFLRRQYALEPDKLTRETMEEIRSRIVLDGLSIRRSEKDTRPSIAVLPFANLSDDPAQEYFSQGVAEELMTALNRVGGLRVASRAASFAFKEPQPDLNLIRTGLDVGAVLQGSVRRGSDTIRVSASLIDVVSGNQLWAETYERGKQDIFAVQENIARSIVSVVKGALTGLDASVLALRPTDDSEAYSLYLQGRYYWNKRPAVPATKGLEYFSQAIARAPNFALAHAAVADVYNTLGSWEASALPSWEAFPKAQEAAIRALELEPHLAEAHTALAYANTHYLWQWDTAGSRFQRAITLRPTYIHAHHWYSHYLTAVGRVQESLVSSRRALELDPQNALMNIHLSWHYWCARQYDEALEQCRRTEALDTDNWFWIPMFFGYIYSSQGKYSLAVDALRNAIQRSSNPVALSALGYAYAGAGETTLARSMVRELEELAKGRRMFSYEIAMIHGALEEIDLAFECLERAVEERSGWMPYINVDPRLDVLRTDSRFTSIQERVGLKPRASLILPNETG